MVTQNTISNSEQNPEEYFKNRKCNSMSLIGGAKKKSSKKTSKKVSKKASKKVSKKTSKKA